MKPVLQVIVTSVLTIGLTGTWLFIRPFDLIAAGLTSAFRAGKDEAKIERTYLDKTSQEVSTGNSPFTNLQELDARWSSSKPKARVILMGNSQTFSVVLAPDERPSSSPPKTYPDLLHDSFESEERTTYRLSAPNLSYLEALWYSVYLTSAFDTPPTSVLLQLNYESFRKSGIRDGMLSLLGNARFRKAVTDVSVSEAPYSDVFRETLRRYQDSRGKAEDSKPNPTNKREDVKTDPAKSIGSSLETGLRNQLAALPQWPLIHTAKADFLNVLYLLRVYVLRITPTTPRPLSGANHTMSVACIHAIADLCKASGITLKLFLAAQNPKAQLWRTKADRDLFLSSANQIASKHGLQLLDLENAVPEEDWGVWIDGPDPIHFGLRGHQAMAAAVARTTLLQ
jgi:hypothetical protein